MHITSILRITANGSGSLVNLEHKKLTRRLILACVLAVAAALIAYGRYVKEVNRLYTESLHQNAVKLTADQPKIGGYRILSAFYDEDARMYQVRVRPTDKEKKEKNISYFGVMFEVDGRKIENYSMIYCSMNMIGIDYILLFYDLDFADTVYLTIGQERCALSA